MRNAKINGKWVDVPEDPTDLNSWLNEHVAYDGFADIETLTPGKPILRWQTITHARKNGKGKGIPIKNLKNN
jgi:hypothetical protein